MLEKIKKLVNKDKKLSNEDKVFFKKTFNYLTENCKFAYSLDYIPRLIRRLGMLNQMNILVMKGQIDIEYQDNNFSLPYVFNIYKGNIIDLNLFILKDNIRVIKKDNTVVQSENILNIPDFIIEDIPEKITYTTNKPILSKDCKYQTSVLYDEYNKIYDLILAMYNDCKLQKVFTDINNMSDKATKKKIDLYFIGEFESLEIKQF